MTHPLPPHAARHLRPGAQGVPVRSGPDTRPRIASDLQIARDFRDHGLAGYVIKSHYTHTAGRAALAREAVPGVNVVGAITLNSAVGGMNALAVELAAREGIRYVWFPTVGAVNEPAGRTDPAPG